MNYIEVNDKIAAAEQEIEQQIMQKSAQMEALHEEIEALQAKKIAIRKVMTEEFENAELKLAVQFVQTQIPSFVANTPSTQLTAQILYVLANHYNKPKAFSMKENKLVVQVRSYEFTYEIWYEGCPESKTPMLKEPTEKNDGYYESYNFLGGAKPSNKFAVLNSNEYYALAAYAWLIVYNRENLEVPIFRLKLIASKKL
jgi:hypothetical protein